MTMESSKLYITGCDKKTRWMLPWFESNFYKHNPDAKLHVFDFDKGNGWFQKPSVMIQASRWSKGVCWLDTDCEVRGNLDPIWNHVVVNKISMAIDKPWSKRRPDRGNWYNSGVVAFGGIPPVLSEWARYIKEGLTKEVGDQEVLNWMLGGDALREMTHIHRLPHKFNTLRIDLIDNTEPKNIQVMHWTGHKGKMEIMEQMK